VYTFRVETLVVRHLEQLRQNSAADFCCAGAAGNSKAIATACDLNVEAVFNLPQVLIKLTTEVGKAVIVGGLENNVPRYLDSTQNLIPKPLCRKLPVRTTGALPKPALNLSEQ
jgi:hypothetical protein